MKQANGNSNGIVAVIDHLGAVREQLKALKDEEARLLEQLSPTLISGV